MPTLRRSARAVPRQTATIKKAANCSATTTPQTFLNYRAIRTFGALRPRAQACVLKIIAHFARVSPSRLYATVEQRDAAHETAAEIKASKASAEKQLRQRIEIRRKLNALHNRAECRKTRRGHFTPAEERRCQALYARLNEIDGVTAKPTAATAPQVSSRKGGAR